MALKAWIWLPGLLSIVPGAQAAWIHVCGQPPKEGPVTVLTAPGGEPLHAYVSDSPPPAGCQGFAIPVAADQVKTIVQAPATLFSTDRITLTGAVTNNRLSVSSVTADTPEPVSRPLPAPLRSNLLDKVQVRPFGVEERVQLSLSTGRLALTCQTGTMPAGVVLTVPWFLPEADMELQVTGAGRGQFQFQMADALLASRGTAVGLGSFAADATAQPRSFSVPRGGLDRQRWHSLTIVCPLQKAELDLESLQLLSKSRSEAGRSTWVWRAQEWQDRSAELFAFSASHKIKVLFITVPVADGQVSDGRRLAAFIQEAAKRRIAVWTVDGDPRMVLPDEQGAAIARARAYATYNATAEPQARLQGMQFDVEPYLLPEYATAPQDWDRRYLDLVAALHAAASGLELEVVVPFWWGDRTELLEGLAPHVNSLSVMDYRTDPQEVYRFAVPFLDWGARHAKRIRIALEAGPVETETSWHYTKAPGGELWLRRLGQIPVLLVLNEAAANVGWLAFRQTQTRFHDGSATSFRKNPAHLLSLLPALERDFSGWIQFGGIALHELPR